MLNNLKTIFILVILYTAIFVGMAIFQIANDNFDTGNTVEYQQF